MSDDHDRPVRSCGTGPDACTACCYTHRVSEVLKDKFTDCTHCDVGVGCRIYSRRPRACGTYTCLWLTDEVGTGGERPDKIGVVCNTFHDSLLSEGLTGILMMEARADALKSAAVKAFITRLLKGGIVVCTGRPGASAQYTFHVLTDGPMRAVGDRLTNQGKTVVWHTKI